MYRTLTVSENRLCRIPPIKPIGAKSAFLKHLVPGDTNTSMYKNKKVQNSGEIFPHVFFAKVKQNKKGTILEIL